VTEVHSLCDVLGEDFIAIVNEVHPGLHEADPGKPTSISDTTLTSLSQVVAMLNSEKTKRTAMVHANQSASPSASLLLLSYQDLTN
jgi:protein regulator of cytokinesis 1